MINPRGVSVTPRKSHTAILYKDSMVVMGGTTETMLVTQQMIAYNSVDQEWVNIKVAGETKFFM